MFIPLGKQGEGCSLLPQYGRWRNADGSECRHEARDGDVFIDSAFGIPPQARFMPRTTLPQFGLGEITKVFAEFCVLVGAEGGRGRASDSTPAGGRAPSGLASCVPRIAQPIGAYQRSVTASQDGSPASTSSIALRS